MKFLSIIHKKLKDILAPGWDLPKPAIPYRFTKGGRPYTTVEDIVNSDAFKLQLEAGRKEREKKIKSSVFGNVASKDDLEELKSIIRGKPKGFTMVSFCGGFYGTITPRGWVLMNSKTRESRYVSIGSLMAMRSLLDIQRIIDFMERG